MINQEIINQMPIEVSDSCKVTLFKACCASYRDNKFLGRNIMTIIWRSNYLHWFDVKCNIQILRNQVLIQNCPLLPGCLKVGFIIYQPAAIYAWIGFNLYNSIHFLYFDISFIVDVAWKRLTLICFWILIQST